MHRRYRNTLPTIWLMTDERQGELLWPALAALPKGAGVIVRHYALSQAARAQLIAQVLAIAGKRRLIVLIAGKQRGLRHLRANGVHNADRFSRNRGGIITAAVHHPRELEQAKRAKVDAVLISPVFPTRSHPRARTLGRSGLIRLARSAPMPVIALGGMTPRRFKSLKNHGLHGWAAIDALTPSIPTAQRPAVRI